VTRLIVPPFSGGVATFEDDDHLQPGGFGVLLQFEQLDLVRLEFLLPPKPGYELFARFCSISS
jgi:hypothetical protein